MLEIFRGKRNIPVVPLDELVIYPSVTFGIILHTKKSKEAIEKTHDFGNEALFVTKIDSKKDPNPENLYHIGTIANINQTLPTDADLKVIAQGKQRAKILGFIKEGPYLLATYEYLDTKKENDKEITALRNNFARRFRDYINLGKVIPMDILITVLTTEDPEKLVDTIIPQIEGTLEDKQAVLEETDLKERLLKATKILSKAISVAELENKVTEKTQEELTKMQKELFLREEMKSIQKELGETEDNEYGELEKKIGEAGMPEEVKKKAEKELSRLRAMPSISPETGYIRTYLDLLVDLPWNKETEAKLDIVEAEKILNEDHFGLEKAKERILEYLAVQKLTGKLKGPILCFVGPPGTGKTSIGKSIARATGRQFSRISLGGVRDEAEIRGHRRTYVGAMPGRIIQGIKQADSRNPVFMLDEIDKIGSDFRGDPSSSLLEVLDPEQNSQYSDHYLEVPFDLSDVIFITTANILDTIPPALKDRMEIITFPGYTLDEKYQIANKFLIPKQLKLNGLGGGKLKFERVAVESIISDYTFEAGVRNLERNIASVCRKVARGISEGRRSPGILKNTDLKKYLGASKASPWTKEKQAQVGTAAALAVTPAGGNVLSVEATVMNGKEQIILTGQLGDVMKESSTAALSYARSRAVELGLDENFFSGKDIHVHVPSGAVPKDGPSAGTAIATALISAVNKKPVREDVAMTGEITLRGKVLRVGGIKDKVLAAHRAGMRTVIVPEENRSDIEELPKNVKDEIQIVLAKTMDQVLKNAVKN